LNNLSAGGLRVTGHFWMSHQWWKLHPTSMQHSFTLPVWDRQNWTP